MFEVQKNGKLSHELDAPPWRRFESTLMATSKSIRRAYDLFFGEIGLNLSEACLLEYVVEHGPMSQTQVAERIGMDEHPPEQSLTTLVIAGSSFVHPTRPIDVSGC